MSIVISGTTVIKEQGSARLTLTGNYQGLISQDAPESAGTPNSICGKLTSVSKEFITGLEDSPNLMML
jgi:hypothetical protein